MQMLGNLKLTFSVLELEKNQSIINLKINITSHDQ